LRFGENPNSPEALDPVRESKMAWVAIEDQRKEEYPPALKVLKFKVLLPNS